MKEENDWTREQAALYPERLTAICGVNPFEKEYALAEIERCAKAPGLRRALSCILEIQTWTWTTLRTSCNSREFFARRTGIAWRS